MLKLRLFFITVKSVTLYEDRSVETRQEEAFSIHSQERFMGLLGAMIPHDANVSFMILYKVLTSKFLFPLSSLHAVVSH